MSQCCMFNAGMQVNHSSQWEAWSVRRSGLLTILLITHENGENGCCEDWLFCGPCYFNRDLQWNVFYPHWGCCAGQLLSHWTVVLLIIEGGLRRQRPKIARADSLCYFNVSFSFSFSDSGDVCFAGTYIYFCAANYKKKNLNKTYTAAKC